MYSRSVALVGRPNVGKSRLFNRLAGRRIAIVHDQPGVTRDVLPVDVAGNFTLMDTGGIGLPSNEATPPQLVQATETQVDLALQAASLILFTVDGIEGCTPLDESIAQQLRRCDKPILLVINKIDGPKQLENLDDFSRLGFPDSLHVSAEHGSGTSELLDHIQKVLGPAPEAAAAPSRIAISFVGRPNVGKSSIVNRLVDAKRLLVSETPGATRDAVALDLDYQAEDGSATPFRLVDTAGLRRGSKYRGPIGAFSTFRTEQAIRQSDVVFLVLESLQGATQYDKTLAGKILEAGCALAILVNKWDIALERFRQDPPEGFDSEPDFRQQCDKDLRRELFFLPDSPIHFISASNGYGMETILETARSLHHNLYQKLPTPRVNRFLSERLAHRTPPTPSGKRFKLYYAVQTGHKPYNIRLFCNRRIPLQHGYQRYLKNSFIEAFSLQGCPVNFELIGKKDSTSNLRKAAHNNH